MMIVEALAKAKKQLAGQVEQPAFEVELLLAHCLEKPRTHLRAWPDKLLSEKELADFNALLDRRAEGVPVAYLLGQREFWSLPLTVNAATLIPRAETELLVEKSLQLMPQGLPLQIADLGTGSGAIALALASERPLAHIHATDISAEALSVAKTNAQKLQLDNLSFYQGSWFAAFASLLRFDCIISNPPYIAENDPHLSQGDLRYEPTQALTPGGDGLSAIRLITEQAKQFLRPEGWLAFEHGYDQGVAVVRIFEQFGYASIETVADLGGQDRVTLGQLKTSLD